MSKTWQNGLQRDQLFGSSHTRISMHRVAGSLTDIIRLSLANVYIGNFSHRQAPTRYYLILQLDLLFDGEGLQSLWNELANNGELSATADNITGIASGIKP